MSEEKKRGCFKQGFLGCLALVGVGLLLMLGFGGLALLDSRRPAEMVQEGSSAQVPVERRPAVATAEQLADARVGDSLELSPDREASAQAAGTLELDLAMGAFTLVPSDGDEIELEGDFDKARFVLDGTMSEDDNGAWRYRVRFGARSRVLPPTGNIRNRVTIHVPRGLPLHIVGKVRMGESKLELGGLSVGAVDLRTEMGEHRISFSEPTPRPMESFELRGRMGGLYVDNLGNGSPRTVDANHQMGEIDLGLEGPWRNDCDLKGRWRMGEMRVHVGDEVQVDVGPTVVVFGEKVDRLRPREDLGPDAPTLHLDLGGAMGQVTVQ